MMAPALFIAPSFIEKGIFLMEMFDAIIPAIPVKDTIKGYIERRLCGQNP